jgi:ELWxxDGT repeat protein
VLGLLAARCLLVAAPAAGAKDASANSPIKLVKDLNPGPIPSDPFHLTVSGGRVFFAAYHPEYQYELWATDGTRKGTRFVADTSQSRGIFIYDLVPYAGGVLFLSQTAALGWEPWFSDGSEAGTGPVADLAPGGSSSSTIFGPELGADRYLTARPGLNSGAHLYRISGTEPKAELVPQPAGRSVSPNPVALGDSLILGAYGSDPDFDQYLYRFDPATGKYTQLNGPAEDVNLEISWDCLAAMAGRAFCVQSVRDYSVNRVTQKLWVSDGTPAGTYETGTVVYSARDAYYPPASATLGNSVLLLGQDPAHGPELWIADGRPDGTRLLRDINPGPASSNLEFMGELGRRVLFAASSPGHGRELWITDGTSAGTYEVRDVNRGTKPSSPRPVATAGGRFFFSANDGKRGRELWSTDGSRKGTKLVVDHVPGRKSSSPGLGARFGRSILFAANRRPKKNADPDDPVGDYELHRLRLPRSG